MSMVLLTMVLFCGSLSWIVKMVYANAWGWLFIDGVEIAEQFYVLRP